jgi:type II secretory pathway pseudopilin PulG
MTDRTPDTRIPPPADAPASGRGLTLGGLGLIVTAGAVLTAAVLPIYRRAYDRTTQRSTIADMRVWARAIEAYAADHGEAPPNPNGDITYKKPIVAALLPYLGRLRTADWWGFHYLIWTGSGPAVSGLELTGPRDYVIVSRGKGGLRESWRYDATAPEAGRYEARKPADFEKDLVLWNGRPVRWPRGRP